MNFVKITLADAYRDSGELVLFHRPLPRCLFGNTISPSGGTMGLL